MSTTFTKIALLCAVFLGGASAQNRQTNLQTEVQGALQPANGGNGVLGANNLNNWYAAFHNCRKQVVRVGVPDDSRSQVNRQLINPPSTVVTGDFGFRWPDLYRQLLQNMCAGVVRSGIVPFTFAWNNQQIGFNLYNGASYTGWHQGNDEGPYQGTSGTGVTVYTDTDAFSIPYTNPFAFDHVNMYCVTGPGLHAWTLTIDGTAAGTCGGAASSYSATLATSSTLTYGVHTGSFSCATHPCEGFGLEGGIYSAGTTTDAPGVILDNTSFGNCAAECFGLNATKQMAFAGLAPGGYSLMILNLISNEPGMGYSTTSFQSALNAIIAHERAQTVVPSFLIYAPLQDTITGQAPYYPILLATAKAQGAAYFDMRDRWPGAAPSFLFGPDGAHEDNGGYAEVFSRVAAATVDLPPTPLASTPITGNCSSYGSNAVVTGITASGVTCAVISGGTVSAPTCGGTPPTGALFNWSASDGLGTTLAESVSSNTATITGGTPTWATPAGISCPAPTYSGTEYATAAVGSATNFNGASTFSVSTWVNVSSFGTFTPLWSNFDGTTGYIMAFDAAQRFDFQIIGSGGSFEAGVPSGATATTGTLYNIVMTYGGGSSASNVQIYVNGAARTMGIASNSLSGSVSSTHPFMIGNYIGGTPLQGTQFGTVIYNRVLTSSEVSSIYSSGAR